jgi:5'(3')-deoxyribonucleotidase
MERQEIIKLSKKNIEMESLEKAKKILEDNYIISYGEYEPVELKKAINEKNPVIIKDNFLIGYDPDGKFVSSNNEKITIDKMVKAIVVEKEIKEESQENAPSGDPFAISGKNEWDEPVSDFNAIFGQLCVGPVFLPPHSAVFNFLNQSEEQKKKKIVSMLIGVNVNIYSRDNCVDNCFHEIGHMFWRDCLNHEEKEAFKLYAKALRRSAIYEYEWEMSSPEEIFCTIYKWYLKSLFVHQSFCNILEFEEPKGLRLLQDVFSRIAHDKKISDIWQGAKSEITEYLNPRFDISSGKYLRKAGALDRIKDIELPIHVLNNVERYENGIEFVSLEKAIVPVRDKKIDLENIGYKKMEKAGIDKPILYFDMDGVVADFVKGYRLAFGRDAYKDDKFTIQQFVQGEPNFFRTLPVLDKGRELFDLLKNRYKIIFLTTPMEGMTECRRDKISWLIFNFGQGYDVIFSDKKEEYVIDEKSILIDDMVGNRKAWRDSGGTAINAMKRNDDIIDVIEDVFADKKEIEKIVEQLAEMDIETEPTEKQKESGNYSKGRIKFKGLDIVIENPKGSWRFGKGWMRGERWAQRMKAHYGYIANDGGQDTADGDKVDVFIGPKLSASRAFVINQVKDGMFDEIKVVLGADNAEEAQEIYLSNYPKGWDGIGSIHQINTKKLREWLKKGNLNEPFTP